MPFLLQRVAGGPGPHTRRLGPPERHRPAPGCTGRIADGVDLIPERDDYQWRNRWP